MPRIRLSQVALTLVFVAGSSLALFSAAVAHADTTIATAPTNGLVGYWNFNEGASIRATDATRNKNNGTLTNGPAWVNGRVGRGLNFDATNDVVVATGTSLSNLPALTASAWVYARGGGENFDGAILNKGQGSSPFAGWVLSFSSQRLIFGVSHNSGVSSVSRTGSDYSVPTLNKWHHVLVTWSGTNSSSSISIYLNGQEVSYQSGQNGIGGRDDDAVNSLKIGNNLSGSRTFDGIIDEVRIYNRVLTPTEIQKVYRAGQVTINKPLPKTTALQTGLVGHWSFNGPDFTDQVYDRSGQNNHGYVKGGATSTMKIGGRIGQGMLFTGVSSKYVEVRNHSSLTFTNGANDLPFSLSYWVKLSSSEGILIYKDSSSREWRTVVTPTSANITLWDSSQNDRLEMTKTAPLPKNRWLHIVWTYDGSETASGIKYYVNGVATSTSDTSSGVYDGMNDVAARTINLGYSRDYGGASAGLLDEVRIYNRVLSAPEIKQLYQNEAGSTVGFVCGKDTVNDADGNVYGTMKVGVQCWMKQNMRVGTRINAAGNQTNNAVVEKYCYSDTASNCTTNHPNQPDGGLYQWDEAMQYSTKAGARGICPAGWHIPTHDQFTTLERNVCTSGSCATDFPYDTSTTGYRGTNEGTKLKPNGTSGWEGTMAGDSSSTLFFNRDASGIFWSSLESTSNAWTRFLGSGDAQTYRATGLKSNAYSVRCLKD